MNIWCFQVTESELKPTGTPTPPNTNNNPERVVTQPCPTCHLESRYQAMPTRCRNEKWCTRKAQEGLYWCTPCCSVLSTVQSASSWDGSTWKRFEATGFLPPLCLRLWTRTPEIISITGELIRRKWILGRRRGSMQRCRLTEAPLLGYFLSV